MTPSFFLVAQMTILLVLSAIKQKRLFVKKANLQNSQQRLFQVRISLFFPSVFLLQMVFFLTWLIMDIWPVEFLTETVLSWLGDSYITLSPGQKMASHLNNLLDIWSKKSSFFGHLSVLSQRRYNLNGFVEELPKLPKARFGHACSPIPTPGSTGQVIISVL